MSVVNELNSVYDYLKSLYPTATIERQDVPSEPKPNTFVVRLQDNESKSETSLTHINAREFQIIYFGSSSVDVLTKADEIDRKLNNDQKVMPIKGSLRYIRVKAFSFSTPFKTASNINGIIGVLQTETREARDLPTYQKIMSVNLTVKE
jgi:hypothetical protein